MITGFGNLAGELGNLLKDAAKPLDKRSALDSIKRSAIDAVNPLQIAKDHISDLLDVVQTEPDLTGSVVNLGAHLAETSRMTAAANAYLKEHKQAVIDDAQAVVDHAADTEIWAAEQEIANHQAKDAADLIDGMSLAIAEGAPRSSFKDDASARVLDQSDALASTAGAQITYNKGLADFKTKSKDAKAGADDVRDAAIGASKAHAALYESMVTSAGGVATATGKLDAQNATLLETARTASGPAKQAIIEYIATLNGISVEKATEIVATADTAQAEQDLKDASVNRSLKITAEAETAQAQKDINSLIAQNAGRSFGIKIIPGFKAPQAAGSITPQGGGTGVGEAGPEFVTYPDGTTVLLTGPTSVPQGTRVTSVRKTRQILARRPRRFANGTSFAGHGARRRDDVRVQSAWPGQRRGRARQAPRAVVAADRRQDHRREAIGAMPTATINPNLTPGAMYDAVATGGTHDAVLADTSDATYVTIGGAGAGGYFRTCPT